MGDPRRLRRKYKTPKHPWEKKRIEKESILMQSFGLKNKQEIWLADTEVSKYVHLAREVIGMPLEQRKSKEAALIGKLTKMGLLKEGESLDDVLSLTAEDLLDRRLQTVVWKRNFARTIDQARQFIVHGHITINGRKATSPGMIIGLDSAEKIGWYKKPLVEIIAKPVEVEKTEVVKEKKVTGEFVCKNCSKKFKSQRGLTIHLKVHKDSK